MKIRQEELKKIIREEILGVLNEVNPWHKGATGNKTGGRFTSKDKAKVYSLSSRAKKLLAKDSELEAPLRGKVTSKGKVSSPAGMNTSSKKSCGRIRFPDGGKKKPVSHECERYSKRYDEALAALEEIAEEMTRTLDEGNQCDPCLQQFIARLRKSNLALKTALDPKVQEGERDTYAGEKISPGDRKTPSRRSTDRRKKFRTMAGLNYPKSGFHPDETKLLRPDSLYE